jgi:hypothetical protein
VNKKVEITDNVKAHYIERYDTMFDLEDENNARLSKIQNQRYKVIGVNFNKDPYDSIYDSSSSDPGSINPHKSLRFCERIYVKRDNVNNVGNLICFPMCPEIKEAEN